MTAYGPIPAPLPPYITMIKDLPLEIIAMVEM